MFSPRHSCALVAIIFAAAIGTSSFAVELLPPYSDGTTSYSGGGVSTGIVLSDHPELAGTTLYDVTVGYYSQFNNPDDRFHELVSSTGTLETTVIREAATGTLDFYYRATYTGGFFPPEDLAIGGFDPSVPLNADYIRPATANATPEDISYGGSSIFTRAFYPLLVRTNLTTFNNAPGSAIVLLDHDFQGTETPMATVVPSLGEAPPAVPEPASLALLPLAVAALGMRFSRRRAL